MFNLKGHEIIFIYIERDIKIFFLANFDRKLRLIVFLQSTVVMDERQCWISLSGGSDNKFEYLALLDPKLQKNNRSAAAFLDFTLQ